MGKVVAKVSTSYEDSTSLEKNRTEEVLPAVGRSSARMIKANIGRCLLSTFAVIPVAHAISSLLSSQHSKESGHIALSADYRSSRLVPGELCSDKALNSLASNMLGISASYLTCQKTVSSMGPACDKAVWYNGSQGNNEVDATPKIELCVEPLIKKQTDDWGKAGNLWKQDLAYTKASHNNSESKGTIKSNVVNGRKAIELITRIPEISEFISGIETPFGKYLVYDEVVQSQKNIAGAISFVETTENTAFKS